LTLSGRASHTGATPMALRSDALAAAAEVVLIAESLATDSQHHGTRATVGRLEVTPGSITTIPGRVSLSVDIRDVDSDRQRQTTIEIVRRARAVCDRRKVGLALTLLGDTSPVILPIWLRRLTTQVCTENELSYRVMTSGASHDSQLINTITPAAIIFVPSRAGLSHVPEEWTSTADLARGTDTLLNALVLADSELGSSSASPIGSGRAGAA
jgi:allantoate deiminase